MLPPQARQTQRPRTYCPGKRSWRRDALERCRRAGLGPRAGQEGQRRGSCDGGLTDCPEGAKRHGASVLPGGIVPEWQAHLDNDRADDDYAARCGHITVAHDLDRECLAHNGIKVIAEHLNRRLCARHS